MPFKNFRKNKTNNNVCTPEMNFQECELAILRHAVDESEKIKGEKLANSDEIQHIFGILENFLVRKKCICYGGTAINNILPKFAQFYNRDIEIPDYDFYSTTPMDDAKELADIYYKAGYSEVEAKAGVHYGTYKVFVNFIPVADITLLAKEIFESIYKEAIRVKGIYYCPPNFLRMNMFLELSRPAGDVSRWEKVLKRMTLLNKYYPFEPTIPCNKIDFEGEIPPEIDTSEKIYYIIRDTFIDEGVVFFGGYASSLYSKYMTSAERYKARSIPDFDVISEEPDRCAILVMEKLLQNGYKKVRHIVHEEIGEIIPKHIEIRVGKETLAFIYYPIACYNYNKIYIKDREIKVATIDTILSFYLAFYYSNKPYYYRDRILCMAKFLFDLEQKNRLEQKGILKRFSINCYGDQPTLESIRAKKAEKYRELKNDRNSREFQEWFLNYKPHTIVKVNTNPNEKKLDEQYSPDPEEKTDSPSKEEVYKRILESVKKSRRSVESMNRTKKFKQVSAHKKTVKHSSHKTKSKH
jgi:Poly(A) polymerase catalytic subunit